MFLKHQISKLEWIPKEHVSLKTGVMDIKKIHFSITGINYILKIDFILFILLLFLFYNITFLYLYISD